VATEVLGSSSDQLIVETPTAGREQSTSVWRRLFGLDARSLALFRIALGLYLVFDLASRLPLVGVFYTDEGVVPRAAIVPRMNQAWQWSVHLISGEWWVQICLFLVAIAFAIGLATGYRTRLCAVMSWFLFTSMHLRNPLVQYFGDITIQALLFWAMFLPLNRRWSLDLALNPESRPAEGTQFSWGTQAYVFQILIIYWFTALMKWHPSWLQDGSAVYYALSLDFSVRPFGTWLLQFPAFLRFLTRVTIAFEILGPLLLVSPWKTQQSRLLAVVLFVGFHLGLALCMDLTAFSLIMVVAWSALVPTLAWDILDGSRGKLREVESRIDTALRMQLAELKARFSGSRRFLTPPAPTSQLGVISRAIVLTALMTILATSLANAPITGVRIPPLWSQLSFFTQTNQQWAMFAAPTFTWDGWYVFDGVLMDGRHVDVWRAGGPVTEQKPADVPGSFKNPEWRAYLIRLYMAKNAEFRVYLGNWLCRTWNAAHTGNDRVNLIYISYMLENTVPPGQTQTPAKKDPVWRQYCFKKPADW
jgi:hypothetical protein